MKGIDWESGSLERIFFSQKQEERGLHPITYFRSLSSAWFEVMKFEGENDSVSSIKNLEEALDEIYPYLRKPQSDAQFSISQMKGQWYGSGVQNYICALKNKKERYRRDYQGLKSHNNESAIMVSSLKKGGVLALSSQPLQPIDPLGNERKGGTRKFSLKFLTEGIPLDTSKYEEICEAFGSNLGNAKKSYAISASATLNLADSPVRVETSPIDIYQSKINDRYEVEIERVEKAVIKNPFRQNEGVVNRFKYESFYEREEVDEKERFIDPFFAPENMVVHLTDRPYREELGNIHLHKVEATIGSGLGNGFDHANICLTGESMSSKS